MKKLIFIFFVVFLNANQTDAGLQAYIHMDYKKAYNLLTQSCNSGDNKACNYVGVLYENGSGVKKDLKKALFYYTKGCKTFSESCLNLGSLQLQLHHKKEANIAFKKACSMGYKAACIFAK